MSTPDQEEAPAEDLERQRRGIAGWERFGLGLYLHATILFLFYFLACLWPLVTAGKVGPNEIRLFGLGLGSFTPDIALLWAVGVLGALGGSLHAVGSFVNFIGNRTFVRSWIWFYLARAPVGFGLAVLVYFALRGGLLNATVVAADNGSHTLNPYGVGALAALTGLFSETATLKLKEVFTAMFRPEEVRKNPLSDAAPKVEGFTPPSIPAGSGDTKVTVKGSGFEATDVVAVNGEAVSTKFVSASELEATIPAGKLTAKAKLKVVVRRAGPRAVASEARDIEIT